MEDNMADRTWEFKNDDGTVTTITTSEWKRRYAARLMERGGMPEVPAIQCAEAGYETALEDFNASPSDGLMDPVEAADEEMSCWEDDGDE
jgi:hypothetical protein